MLEYSARNLLARLKYVLPTVAAIASVLAAVTVLYSLASSAEAMLTRDTDDRTMVVMAQRARGETTSSLPAEAVGAIQVASGVDRSGEGHISVEYVTTVWMDYLEGGLEGARAAKQVRLRGAEANALSVHSGVRLASGRFPARGEQAVVVGRNLLGRFEGLQAGGALHLGKRDWPVIGELESDGPCASEIWGDRTALSEEFHHPGASVAYVQLDSVEHRGDFAQSIARTKGLEAISEREVGVRRGAVLGLKTHVQVMTAFALLLAIGAIFASFNALHGSLLARVQELATLLAIGFTRGRVLWLALQESLLVAAIAVAVGLPFAFLVDGKTLLFTQTLFYTVHVEGAALLAGLATVAAIAMLCGIAAGIQILRMSVLVHVRGA